MFYYSRTFYNEVWQVSHSTKLYYPVSEVLDYRSRYLGCRILSRAVRDGFVLDLHPELVGGYLLVFHHMLVSLCVAASCYVAFPLGMINTFPHNLAYRWLCVSSHSNNIITAVKCLHSKCNRSVNTP